MRSNRATRWDRRKACAPSLGDAWRAYCYPDQGTIGGLWARLQLVRSTAPFPSAASECVNDKDREQASSHHFPSRHGMPLYD